MSGVITGGDTRVNLQQESSFKSADGAASPYVPGASGTLETAEATNNITRITNFGSDTAIALKEGNFDGAFSLSWALTNPWWLNTVFGDPSTTDNGDGSHTHSYSLGDAESFQIIEGYETSTTAERVLKGCVTGRIAIEPSVDEDAATRVTMEGFYADETTNTSVTLTSQDGLDDDVLSYADATLKRDGSAEALVQNATLEIAWRTSEPIDEFGSRVATDYLVGLLEPTLDYQKIKQDADTVQDVYGGASATTVNESLDNAVSAELAFDNGKAAGSGINKHVFSLSSTKPESYDDGVDGPASAITEALNRAVTDVTVDVTNETASPP